jgi:hypothetical protein
MEQISGNLRKSLQQFIQVWIQERGKDEEIRITSSAVLFETLDRIESIDISELMSDVVDDDQHKSLVDKCEQDLDRPGYPAYIPPVYTRAPALEQLSQIVEKPLFQQRKTNYRLETYYYLGRVLSSRGWIQEDKQFLCVHFNSRKVREIKRTAKRVHELFSVRGVAHLYSVNFIRPSHLAKLEETEFYLQLIPEAQWLKELEKVSQEFNP